MDNTSNVNNIVFVNEEAASSTRFDCKSQFILEEEYPVMFNGTLITKNDDGYILTQSAHIEKLSTVVTAVVNEIVFVSERARGAYIATVSRPDLTFGFSICSKYCNPNAAAVKRLKNVISYTMASVDIELKFVKLDISTVEL